MHLPRPLLHPRRRFALPAALLAGVFGVSSAILGVAPAAAADAAPASLSVGGAKYTLGAKFTAPASARATYNFNPAWKFIRQDVAGAEAPGFDDSSWTTISTPHTWNDVDTYRAYIKHSGGDVSGMYMGVGWYRKHFKLPASAKGGKVFIEFEGMKQAGRFFLNGQPLGKFENGVTACGLDITQFAKFGDEENVLAVKVDNSNNYVEEDTRVGFQWMGKDFNPNFGGLNHNVWLHTTGKVYQTLPLYENLKTTGVYIYGKNYDIPGKSTDVNIESQVRNESGDFAPTTLASVVVDRDGVIRALIEGNTSDIVDGQTETFNATGKLAGARFWNVDDPYLYDVYTLLSVDGKVVDVCKTTTGFRKVEFKGGAGTGGVYINDKFVWLTGYAQRSVDDWAGLGQAYPNWMHDFNAALIRASNGNHIRWMHIAPQRADVQACDKFGIVQTCPAGDKERDVQGRQWEQRVEVMRDTIIYYRNHPSILFWEAGNTVVSVPHIEEMVALRKIWDPEGGRVMGARGDSNNAANTAATPIAEYYGVMIGQAPQTDALQGPTDMFRAYSAERRDRAPIIETEDFRDEALRGIWDDFSPPTFGFKPVGNTTDENGRPVYGDTWHWNSETFAVAAANRYASYALNRIDNPDPAHSKWSGYASIYWSDSNADGRQERSAVLRVSGKVDGVRLPKEVFYMSRVMQSAVPDIHIIGHWTYPANTKKTMYVAATLCDQVELFVNGQSKGVSKEPCVFVDPFNNRTVGYTGYVYAFPDIAFEPGTLKAVATKGGQVVAQQEYKTAGAPKAIRLTLHTGPQGLQADGSDVALVDFEVVDAEGNRCPTDEGRVDFAVDGPAIWRGGLNASKLNSTNNLYLNTECGINRVAIRSVLQPGAITLTATREGLTPATLKIQSQPVQITGGLATSLPQGYPGLYAPVPNLVPKSATAGAVN